MAKLGDVSVYSGYKSKKTKNTKNNSSYLSKNYAKPAANSNTHSNSNINSITHQCLQDVLINQQQPITSKNTHTPICRPSGFPFCAVHHFSSSLAHSLAVLCNIEQKSSMSVHGEFFTGVGTAVHTVLQKALCNHSEWGNKLWGDFICNNENCTRHTLENRFRNQFRPKACDSCAGNEFTYEEIEIDVTIPVEFNGKIIQVPLKGHVDTVLFDTPLSCVVIDYKTTSLRALDEHKEYGNKFPYQHNVEQVNAYAALLSLPPFNLPVTRTALAYVARDLISRFTVCERSYGETEHEEALSNINLNAKQVAVAQQSVDYIITKLNNLVNKVNSKTNKKHNLTNLNLLKYINSDAFVTDIDKAFSYVLKNRLCLGNNITITGKPEVDNANPDLLEDVLSDTITNNHNLLYAPKDIRSWKTCPYLSLCSRVTCKPTNIISSKKTNTYAQFKNAVLSSMFETGSSL